LDIRVYEGKDGSFALYEDEGTNYNYEKGAFSIIPFQYNETAKTLTIGNRVGQFKGMLQTRVFRVIFINQYGKHSVRITSYSGSKIVLRLSKRHFMLLL